MAEITSINKAMNNVINNMTDKVTARQASARIISQY